MNNLWIDEAAEIDLDKWENMPKNNSQNSLKVDQGKLACICADSKGFSPDPENASSSPVQIIVVDDHLALHALMRRLDRTNTEGTPIMGMAHSTSMKHMALALALSALSCEAIPSQRYDPLADIRSGHKPSGSAKAKRNKAKAARRKGR